MGDDRARPAARAGRPALAALARVVERRLRRPLGDADSLQADREAGIVHHREHAVHAAVLFAQQVADRAALVAVHHGAGGRAVNAELVLDRVAAHVVAGPERAVLVDEELRHDEERDALGAGGRIGQPCEHEMHDVVGQVVLAVGDEDLAAGEPIGAVAGGLGARAQRADVGAGLRLGELHGAGPLAGHELRQVGLLEVLRSVAHQRLDARHGQRGPDAERHRGPVPHLDAGRVEGMRQALAAPGGRSGEPVPAGGRPVAIGLASSPAAW